MEWDIKEGGPWVKEILELIEKAILNGKLRMKRKNKGVAMECNLN